MQKTIITQHISKCASQCPFYVSDTNGVPVCFFKNTLPLRFAKSTLSEYAHAYDDRLWEIECQGEFSKCSIVPLLWHGQQPQAVQTNVEDINSFDPFGEEEKEAAVNEKPSPSHVEKKNTEPAQVEKKQYQGVLVTLHMMQYPAQAKVDGLFYPTNTHLAIDDREMQRTIRRSNWIEELNKVDRPAPLGDVIVCYNEVTEKNTLKASYVFNAVVAGPARLVNESEIISTVRKTILMADDMGLETLAFWPADCGTLSIYDTANYQLSAIKNVLQAKEFSSLKRIFIVMSDEISHNAFKEYYDRIFSR